MAGSGLVLCVGFGQSCRLQPASQGGEPARAFLQRLLDARAFLWGTTECGGRHGDKAVGKAGCWGTSLGLLAPEELWNGQCYLAVSKGRCVILGVLWTLHKG